MRITVEVRINGIPPLEWLESRWWRVQWWFWRRVPHRHIWGEPMWWLCRDGCMERHAQCRRCPVDRLVGANE